MKSAMGTGFLSFSKIFRRSSLFSVRGGLAFLYDLIAAGGAFFVALQWRLALSPNIFSMIEIYQLTGMFLAASVGAFLVFKPYRGLWRYSSVHDMNRILKAGTLAVFLFLAGQFFVDRLEFFPRSSLVGTWFLMVALMGGARLFYRAVWGQGSFSLSRGGLDKRRVLLVGLNDDAANFIREMNRVDSEYQVLGLVDLKKNRIGHHLHGIKVIGHVDDLADIVNQFPADQRPERLVLSADIKGTQARAIVDTAIDARLSVWQMPHVGDLSMRQRDGHVAIKPIDIHDLLGRDPKQGNAEKIAKLISGKRVLITGAGGSIGSELVRQVIKYNPASLCLIELSEFNLYTIDMEVEEIKPDIPRYVKLCDVRDEKRLNEIFAEEKPELVFHAAAFKHVPLVEVNVREGVHTNVIGTQQVADACVAHNVPQMVFISTDKAVNPTNVMGASKRLAESYCQALDMAHGSKHNPTTRFTTVRFGNVLGSTGSVIPLFQRQLAQGGPITVTHPDITRYFMTIPEAVGLVLQAATDTSTAQQPGAIYVLDMGKPIKIMDLAHQMIRLAGLVPDKDIKIDIIGLRPGEKLHEELFHDQESLSPSGIDHIHMAKPRTADLKILQKQFKKLHQLITDDHESATLMLLSELVPEFDHSGSFKVHPQRVA